VRSLGELSKKFVDGKQEKGSNPEPASERVQIHDQTEYREDYEKRAKCS
jgi:hypothetical protein